MDYPDLVNALRLWLPEGGSLESLRQELADTLAAAFSDFDQTVPRSGLKGPADVMPLATAAAARGLLQEALQESKGGAGSAAQPRPVSAELRRTLAQLAWGDLLFVAACAGKNEPANSRLLSMVQTQVLPALSRKWGRDRAQDIVDELPQKLHLLDQRGLNRGRPRLLAYGGRSRLATWLRAVAHQTAIDRWRRQSRERQEEEMVETAGAGGEQEGAGRLAHDEDLDLVRRTVPQAFEQLMRELPNISEQQHRFAYYRCVCGLDNGEIAEKLGVVKSRVTELSQQVFRRLIAILRKLAPELNELSDDASKERRRMFEEALQEWFGETAPDGTGASPHLMDEQAVPTLRVTGVEDER